jgi:hypothetical protein
MALTLLGRMSLSRIARVGSNFALGLVSPRAKSAAHGEIFAELNDMGLEGLYRTFLSGSGTEIARALRIVADRRNHPVLLHCSHGKDRTGLTVALILALVGVPRALIVADYHLSESHGLSDKGRAFFKHPEMDPDYCAVFLIFVPTRPWNNLCSLKPTRLFDAGGRAPPHVMEATLDYINNHFGGVSAYLDRIGFDASWQRRLISAMTHQ